MLAVTMSPTFSEAIKIDPKTFG